LEHVHVFIGHKADQTIDAKVHKRTNVEGQIPVPSPGHGMGLVFARAQGHADTTAF
jgi:hypothetical protein